MIDLFKAPKTDASLEYLSKIFGNVSGVINQGDSITLLSTMFKTFNSVILTVAVLMLVYITIVGVMATAHEGEFMGKKWNNIWLPIRAVLGIALLVPTGAGYCGIQIIMMWVIVQGVGAADTLWNTALSYVQNVGSPYAQVGVPTIGASQVIGGLFQGLTCDASSRQLDNPRPGTQKLGGYYCTKDCGETPKFNRDEKAYILGPEGGACGSLSYCDSSAKGACAKADSLECAACKSQLDALDKIVPVLSDIAKSLVAADYSYRDFYNNSALTENTKDWGWIKSYCADHIKDPEKNCCFRGATGETKCEAPPKDNPLPDVDNDKSSPSDNAVKNLYWPYYNTLQPTLGVGSKFIDVATKYYIEQANKAVTSYLQSQGEPKNSQLKDVFATAQEKGWIYAGGFYYNIANEVGNNLEKTLPKFEWNSPDWSKSAMEGKRNNYTAAKYLIGASAGETASTTNLSSNPEVADIKNSTLNSVKDGFVRVVQNEGGNPLLVIIVFGRLMLVTAQILFLVLMGLVFAVGISGSINAMVFGTGLTENPLGKPALMVMVFVLPALYGLFALMVTVGALLAIYTPLIPYIVFTMGAISWLISAVEAMVAGPLVALGVISPSGQHEIMGQAEPAIMLLFDIFLRPSLMIFGLMAAMLLASVVVSMIAATFKYIFMGKLTLFAIDPLTLLFVLVAYVSIILAALNKCFAVINLIPQQVMRWISGHGEQVDSGLQEIKGGIDAAGGKVAGAGGLEGATGEQHRERKEEKRAEDREKGGLNKK